MKNFSIDIVGRVNNFNLPMDKPLIPLYEAIVNSIHAIEERRKDWNGKGSISIETIRSTQGELFENNELPQIEGFKIVDNGIGFDDNNMQSFMTSDSTYKASIGCKGVGRFSWLKAFELVEVSSIYKTQDASFEKRTFLFSKNNTSVDDKLEECKDVEENITIVKLLNYTSAYKDNVPKDIRTIAIRIIQHCLVYFLNESCPMIEIKDGKGSKIVLNNLFEEIVNKDKNIFPITINGKEFSILNIKVSDKNFPGNRLYLCANNRLVKSKKLEKSIVDMGDKFFTKNNFWYVGIVRGKYLDDNVDMNRLSFSIPESNDNLLHSISIDDILKETCAYIENYLKDYLEPIRKEKIEHITEYMNKNAPQYKHLLKYKMEEIKKIKPNLSDDKLDDALHGVKRQYEKEIKKEARQLTDKIAESDVDFKEYSERFKEVVEKISSSNKATLAEYVAHRSTVINLFEKGLYRKDDGKFNKEAYMHKLIYPMRKTSDDVDYDTHNLWLIDEKLSYCTFISSDVPFDNNSKEERTDILCLDNPIAVTEGINEGTVFNTVILFELKRPMRDDYNLSENPITQLYGYVDKIKNGKAKDKNHRIIKVDENTKFYLYAVCDDVPSLLPVIKNANFNKTPDGLGYYGHNAAYNAYIEVLSYDKILMDAKKRNRVLFDKLGLN